MRYLLIIVFFLTWLARGYEVTSIEFSDWAQEFPKEKRVVLETVTDRFSISTSTIHALIRFKGVGEHDPITVRWIRESQDGAQEISLGEFRGTLGPQTEILHLFYHKDDFTLPPGRYRVEVLRDAKVLAKKYFTIYQVDPDEIMAPQITPMAEISQIYLANGFRKNPDGSATPVGIGDHFSVSDHKLYTLVPYEHLPKGLHYTIEWIVVDNVADRNKLLAKSQGVVSEEKSDKGTLYSEVTMPRDWLDGIYEVVLRIEGKATAVKRFMIGDPGRIKEHGVKPVEEAMDPSLQKKLIGDLARWMSETIEKRDFHPLYEHAVHYWRDQVDWNLFRKGFQSLFDAPVDWKAVFSRSPRLFPVLHNAQGVVILWVIYPGAGDASTHCWRENSSKKTVSGDFSVSGWSRFRSKENRKWRQCRDRLQRKEDS